MGFVPFDPTQAGRSNPVIQPAPIPAPFPARLFNPATDYRGRRLSFLEDEFHRELDLARSSQRVDDLAGTLVAASISGQITWRSPATGKQSRNGQRVIRMVEDVEEFRAELQAQIFANLSVLQNGQIDCQ